MATIRLIPSIFYNAAGTSYLTVSNQNNALTNTDSTTYATVSNVYASTTNRYVYLQGFNWDDIPSGAIINSFSIKLKASESGGTTSSSYRPVLCKGTSTYSNAYCSAVTTSATVHEFSFTQDFDTFRDDGDEFGIRINCRRSSRNTAASFYIYGAEIEVDYTIPNPATVTTTLSGNGTISPSGTTNTYEGAEFELTITPTDKSETVTATQDGVDITDRLVAHGTGATATIVPESATTHSIQSGSSYAQYAVGHSAESPSSSTSNMYASSGSTGYAEYSFDFSDIPSNAIIESIEVRCHGHRESSTISSTYVSQCAIYNGSTAVSDTVDFPSTSASIITLEPNTTITRTMLDNLTVRHYVGYYGGLVTGISFVVTYSTGTGIDHYTYTYTVSGDSVIAVIIGGIAPTNILYFKENGSWTSAIKAYKKVNGSWVQQSDLTTVFDSNTKYVCGNAPLESFLAFSQGQTASSVKGSTCSFLSPTISHAAYVPVRLVGSIHATHDTREADYSFDVIINLTRNCPCINITPWPSTLVESIYISPSINSDIVTQIYFNMLFSTSATSSARNTVELTSNCNFYDLGNFETIYTYNYSDGGTPPAISLSSANLQNGDVCVLSLLSSANSSAYPGHSYVDSLYKEFIWDSASHTFVGDNERISANVTASSITFSGFDTYQSIFFGRKL